LRRSICAALLCCLFVGGCADSASEELDGYVVRPQDTLYSIAWRHNLDFRDLARWNNIGTDFHISIGQRLTLRPRQGQSQQPPPPLKSPRPQAARPTSGRTPLPAPIAMNPAQHWVWPTDLGTLPIVPSAGGILISGSNGQDIRAATAGRVVYTGNGIRGYGNLIIIKHDNSLLSAYAHNREMLVREGQDVAGGQVIAHMGEGTAQKPSLYFEIRQNGRPVDPMPFMSSLR
jgi:lipoprotein NlpD